LVKLAKKDPSMPKNVEVKRADAIKLPFAAESFDVAVSNGLTHYLERGRMREYVEEVSRVLKDGGRYLEAFTEKEPDDLLPITDKEYLTSAKALLVCLIDNLVSKVDADSSSVYKNTEHDFQTWDFEDMNQVFFNNGVYLGNQEEKDGMLVVEFVRDKRKQAQNRRGYLSGASY
jgi:ubiquinone/menaquinone biosynthesis C-methylase UbiE